MTTAISRNLLDALFLYDPQTGYMKWRDRRRGVRDDLALGSIYKNPSGTKYLRCAVNGSRFFVHRLAYILFHGEIPNGLEVDHIDGDGLNNAISNLRLVSTKENAKNRHLFSTNTTGYCGVYKKACGKYYAQIKVDGKLLSLGTFVDIVDAAKARKAAEGKYGFSPRYGEGRIERSRAQPR